MHPEPLFLEDKDDKVYIDGKTVKRKVLKDSVASLPLAEYDLAICYQQLGNKSQSASHFAAVEQLWSQADGLRTRLPRKR